MKERFKYYAKRIRNVIVFYITGSNKIKDKGNNNHIGWNNSSYIRNSRILIRGNNNTVLFGDDCNMSGLRILIAEDNNVIEFGKGVTVNASPAQPTVINAVGGKTIRIGEGCLFSNNIEIHTTDYHGIYNSQGIRINSDKNVFIGKNVWIGLGVKILKGTEIPDGCVVGAGSLLSGKYRKENVIIVGNPAKIIKERIFWKDERIDEYQVPSELKGKWDCQQ